MNEKELLELGCTSYLENIEQILKLENVLIVRDYLEGFQEIDRDRITTRNTFYFKGTI